MKAPSPRPIQTVGGQQLQVSCWFPDETLYSLCCREHVLSGARLSNTTTNRLFGHPRIGSRHDMPAGLGHFVSATDGRFGSSVQALCRQRTVLSFYLPWRNLDTENKVLEMVAGTRSGTVKQLLGIPASRFGARHPMKQCSVCAANDTATYGTAYWHLEHQYPGVWWCIAHNHPLHVRQYSNFYEDHFLWRLPNKPGPEAFAGSDDNMSVTDLTLAHVIVAATKALAPTRISYDTLHATYLRGLRDCGLTKGRNTIHLKTVAAQYTSFLQLLTHSRELDALPRSVDGGRQYLQSVLYRGKLSSHPLRHLLFIAWLFGDWSRFWATYECSSSEAPRCAPVLSASTTRGVSYTRNRAIELVAGGASARSAARTVGVDIHTVQVWAAQAGATTVHRSSKVRRAIISLLIRGTSKVEVAKTMRVSVQTVTRILCTEVGLSERWHQAKQQQARTRARKEWSAICRRRPSWGTSQLRAVLPGVYAWLYRNDREWLTANSRAAQHKPAERRLDWRSRDQSVAGKISEALRTHSKGSEKVMKIGTLLVVVPDLPRQLAKLDQLPKTHALLETHTSRRRARASNRLTGQEK